MQLEQKKQRALMEQKVDHVINEFNKEKAKEHDIEEAKKKEAKLLMRKSIDEFNHNMLQHGGLGKLPASQECGNLFAHRLEKGSAGNVSHDEVRDALLKQIEVKDQLKAEQKQKDAQFESHAIQQAIREQQVFEAQLKQNKVAKQQQAREVFMRQMAERRGQTLPAAQFSEFDMLPGKSESDAKIERRQKAQQLLEEVGPCSPSLYIFPFPSPTSLSFFLLLLCSKWSSSKSATSSWRGSASTRRRGLWSRRSRAPRSTSRRSERKSCG
jgi:hypothetical protein